MTINIYNEADIDRACLALEQWFLSQDITAKDSMCVMIRLIARFLTNNTSDAKALAVSATQINDLLLAEVAGYLRK